MVYSSESSASASELSLCQLTSNLECFVAWQGDLVDLDPQHDALMDGAKPISVDVGVSEDLGIKIAITESASGRIHCE